MAADMQKLVDERRIVDEKLKEVRHVDLDPVPMTVLAT